MGSVYFSTKHCQKTLLVLSQQHLKWKVIHYNNIDGIIK